MKKLVAMMFAMSFMCLGCKQSGEIDISLKLKKNDAFKVIVESVSTVDQEYHGRENRAQNKQTIVYVLKVDSLLSEGNYIVAMQYTTLSQGTPQSYDQNSGYVDIAHVLNQIITGKTFYLTITPQWKVIDVSGINVIRQEMFDTLMQNVLYKVNVTQLFPTIDEFLSESYSTENFKRMFQYLSGAFPDRPVSIGSRWKTYDILSTTGLQQKMRTEYQLKEVQNGRIRIAMKMRLKQVFTKVSKEQQIESEEEVKGTQEGDVYLEQGRCCMKETIFSQNMKGTTKMKVTSNGQIKVMKYPTTINIETTMTTVELF
jgi:hypothetical protein